MCVSVILSGAGSHDNIRLHAKREMFRLRFAPLNMTGTRSLKLPNKLSFPFTLYYGVWSVKFHHNSKIFSRLL